MISPDLQATLDRLYAHVELRGMTRSYATDFGKTPAPIGAAVHAKLPTPCDHADVRWNWVTDEWICRCGARKDLHDDRGTWRQPTAKDTNDAREK